jgi:hypothetical protein
VFQKSNTGNILRIGRNKSRTFYFYQSFAKTEDETEGGQATWSHFWRRLSTYLKPPKVQTLIQSAFFPEQFRSAAAIEDKF